MTGQLQLPLYEDCKRRLNTRTNKNLSGENEILRQSYFGQRNGAQSKVLFLNRFSLKSVHHVQIIVDLSNLRILKFLI